jgi:hypothetical protein
MPKQQQLEANTNLPRQVVRTPVTLKLPEAHPKQFELINAFELHKDKNVRFVAGACGTKFGKLLRTNELVPTPDGWREHGSLKEGDYVFDQNGNPTKVIWTSGTKYDRNPHKITFSDGSILYADAEHLWLTETHTARKNQARVKSSNDRCKSTSFGAKVVTTREIMESLTIDVGGLSRPNHSITNCKPVNYTKKSFLLDPYILGAWLGDGSTGCGGMTGIDEEIFDEITKLNFCVVRSKTTNKSWYVHSLIPVLKNLGVAFDKHVPSQYLFGSVEQRLALLQGLMDTDGTIGKSGHCCFDNTNKRLSDAVAELCHSLGIITRRYTKQGMLYGVAKKLVYRVHFTTDLPVFRLSRKLARIRPVSERAKKRYITSIEVMPVEPMNCIAVESPDHLYLAGTSYIVTHNTYGCAVRITQEAWLNDHSLNWWVAPVHAQAEIAFAKVQELIPKTMMRVLKGDRKIIILNPDGTDRSTIEFKSAENEGNLRGAAVNFFIIDEAARVSYQAFVSVLTTVTQTRGRGIVISTPKGRNWFYNVYQWGNKFLSDGVTLKYDNPADDKHSEWMAIRMPTWANPFVPTESIEEARKQVPSDVFQQEYGAEFLDESAGVFKNIVGCRKGLPLRDTNGKPNYFPIPFHQYVIGVDLAKHRDYTVLTVMDKQTKHVVDFERFNQISWEIQYSKIIMLCHKWNRALCVIDSTGIGDPIVETLRSAGLPVEPYKISSNMAKRQLIDKLRVGLEQNRLSFPNIAPIIHELEIYEYTTSQSGVVQYSSPDGEHDDCVISLALAVWVADSAPFTYNFSNLSGV